MDVSQLFTAKILGTHFQNFKIPYFVECHEQTALQENTAKELSFKWSHKISVCSRY